MPFLETYGRHSLDESDVAAVVKQLRAEVLTQGSKVTEFERAIARVCNVRYVSCQNSATSSLIASLMALGVGIGSRVYVPTNTFVATANAAKLLGAEVVFIDIDLASFNISVVSLEKQLKQDQLVGQTPSVVIPVHFAGSPAPMAEIFALSMEYGFKIVEDASHALGASYNGSPIGDCEYSDLTVFSFHPVKMITSCEGGAVTTKDSNLLEKVKKASSHGIEKFSKLAHYESGEKWLYEQTSIGFNFRMSDIHAAVGLNQLEKLSKFIDIRSRLVERYRQMLLDFDEIVFQVVAVGNVSSNHLLVVRMPIDIKNRVISRFDKCSVGYSFHYPPMHRHPYYASSMTDHGSFANSERYYRECITLPLHCELSMSDVELVCELIQGEL